MFQSQCEACGATNLSIVEYRDDKLKKNFVDFVKCEACGHIKYIEIRISKRELKKKIQ